MRMQHQTNRVPLGTAAHSQPNLVHVAQQDMVRQSEGNPAVALGEVDRPRPAFQPAGSAIAVRARVPSLLGPEAVCRIGYPRDGLLDAHQSQVIKQQRPRRLQAMLNVQGQHPGPSAHLAVIRPTPMTPPSAERNRDAHPAALRALDRLLERLPRRIAVAKYEIIALWPLKP